MECPSFRNPILLSPVPALSSSSPFFETLDWPNSKSCQKSANQQQEAPPRCGKCQPFNCRARHTAREQVHDVAESSVLCAGTYHGAPSEDGTGPLHLVDRDAALVGWPEPLTKDRRPLQQHIWSLERLQYSRRATIDGESLDIALEFEYNFLPLVVRDACKILPTMDASLLPVIAEGEAAAKHILDTHFDGIWGPLHKSSKAEFVLWPLDVGDHNWVAVIIHFKHQSRDPLRFVDTWASVHPKNAPHSDRATELIHELRELFATGEMGGIPLPSPTNIWAPPLDEHHDGNESESGLPQDVDSGKLSEQNRFATGLRCFDMLRTFLGRIVDMHAGPRGYNYEGDADQDLWCDARSYINNDQLRADMIGAAANSLMQVVNCQVRLVAEPIPSFDEKSGYQAKPSSLKMRQRPYEWERPPNRVVPAQGESGPSRVPSAEQRESPFESTQRLTGNANFDLSRIRRDFEGIQPKLGAVGGRRSTMRRNSYGARRRHESSSASRRSSRRRNHREEDPEVPREWPRTGLDLPPAGALSPCDIGDVLDLLAENNTALTFTAHMSGGLASTPETDEKLQDLRRAMADETAKHAESDAQYFQDSAARSPEGKQQLFEEMLALEMEYLEMLVQEQIENENALKGSNQAKDQPATTTSTPRSAILQLPALGQHTTNSPSCPTKSGSPAQEPAQQPRPPQPQSTVRPAQPQQQRQSFNPGLQSQRPQTTQQPPPVPSPSTTRTQQQHSIPGLRPPSAQSPSTTRLQPQPQQQYIPGLRSQPPQTHQQPHQAAPQARQPPASTASSIGNSRKRLLCLISEDPTQKNDPLRQNRSPARVGPAAKKKKIPMIKKVQGVKNVREVVKRQKMEAAAKALEREAEEEIETDEEYARRLEREGAFDFAFQDDEEDDDDDDDGEEEEDDDDDGEEEDEEGGEEGDTDNDNHDDGGDDEGDEE